MLLFWAQPTEFANVQFWRHYCDVGLTLNKENVTVDGPSKFWVNVGKKAITIYICNNGDHSSVDPIIIGEMNGVNLKGCKRCATIWRRIMIEPQSKLEVKSNPSRRSEKSRPDSRDAKRNRRLLLKNLVVTLYNWVKVCINRSFHKI